MGAGIEEDEFENSFRDIGPHGQAEPVPPRAPPRDDRAGGRRRFRLPLRGRLYLHAGLSDCTACGPAIKSYLSDPWDTRSN